MPLIIISGYPSSGKTKWAKLLANELEKKITKAGESSDSQLGHNYKVIYHSDDLFGIKHDTYEDSNKEKLARGSQISAVKRDISKTNIVILDSMAYIKGFRYQLYCESKGTATPHCIVHVIAPINQCLEWNDQKSEGEKWKPELIKQLEMRYEEPNSDTRWDSPLFQIISNDPNEKIPIDEIWNALVLKKAPTPNAATTLQSTSDNSFLQELDRKTHEIISAILQQQQITSGNVQIGDYIINIPMGVVSTAQLQRIRRSFISLNRMRTIDKDRITPLFIDYLNGSLNNED
ncbi:KTI12 [Candida jiufengensis]|uniref:KTI12 n=1 Tax=Candida jiufengensis TaxID=497108 RepID=UPI002225A728|nr:KTI12 [Candida jiufengensis]KAI5951108.1 KTI12 [Candida jiufengensis]